MLSIAVVFLMLFGLIYMFFAYRTDPHGPAVTGQRSELPNPNPAAPPIRTPSPTVLQ